MNDMDATEPKKRLDPPDPVILESPEAVLSTMTREGKRRWIYPILSKGRFLNNRRAVAWVLIILYVALPLIPVAGKPAILLDVASREFVFFGLTLYPTDTLLLLIMLVGIMAVVILGTALLGRVWCGWACPQTVYLEFVFRPIERLIEGKEHVRQRRDEGPLTFDKAWRKGLKFSVYLAISLVLAHTFVAYFTGWDQLISWMTESPTENWGFFVIMALTTGLVLFDFGYFREQMCTIACPYARMQSIMVDEDSLIVSYDPTRGEPRSRRSKKKIRQEEAGVIEAMGDCIDCAACVRTCPTGIDIRDGLQMECVACTQCVDACDSIMDAIGKPRGLIRYTSERELGGKKTRIWRPRTVLYSALLVLALSAFTVVISARDSFDVNVGRAVGAPYTELPDGRIANRLRFRVRNQSGTPSDVDLGVVQPAGAELRIVGVLPENLASGEITRFEVWVVAPVAAFENGRTEGVFRLDFAGGVSKTETFALLGPTR